MANGVHSSSSHRKQVGMRGMQSGNAVMEGAAVAGQIAKESERKGGSRRKDRESEKVIRKGWGASNYHAHTGTLGCLQSRADTLTHQNKRPAVALLPACSVSVIVLSDMDSLMWTMCVILEESPTEMPQCISVTHGMRGVIS